MTSYKFYTRITICLFLIAMSLAIGLFHDNILCVFRDSNSHALLTSISIRESILPVDVSFFIYISSLFVFLLSFILNANYVSLFQMQSSSESVKKFTDTIMKIDSNMISSSNLASRCNEFVSCLSSNELRECNFYSKLLPCIVSFLTIAICMLFFDVKASLLLLFIILFFHLIIPFFTFIKNMFDVNGLMSVLQCFCYDSLRFARGVQFFDAKTMMRDLIARDISRFRTRGSSHITSDLWRFFFLMCVLLCFLCVIYFATDKKYVMEIFSSYAQYNIPITFAIILYILNFHFYSVIKKVKYIDLDNIIPYYFCLQDNIVGEKLLPCMDKSRDMFIAFHGVCFHEPSSRSSSAVPIFNELTFSILPGEIIAITGENRARGLYIFDLILKYYHVQSGNIYVSGTNINSVDTNSLRSRFSIFKVDFCIVKGTVEDNVKIAVNNLSTEKLLEICKKVDLIDNLKEQIFNDHSEIIASEETLIRIQMARVLLRKGSKVVLVDVPETFKSDESKALFYDFMNFISKKKTVILITNTASLIIYSSKILYLGKTKDLFGSHAELSDDTCYQKFLSQK